MTETTPYDPELMAAVTELGAALRELVDTSVRTTVPAEQLLAAAAHAREITTGLSASTREVNRMPALDDPIAFRRVFSPVTGVGNALAPPITAHAADGGVRAETTLGLVYEGPPGLVHGGMSGLLMDHMLGAAAVEGGCWGMTAHLEMDYRGPVPLQTPVLLRGWIAEEHGRKTLVSGSIATAADPDRVLVAASGVFVTPRQELMGDYFGGITDASGAHAPPGRPTDATAVVVDD